MRHLHPTATGLVLGVLTLGLAAAAPLPITLERARELDLRGPVKKAVIAHSRFGVEHRTMSADGQRATLTGYEYGEKYSLEAGKRTLTVVKGGMGWFQKDTLLFDRQGCLAEMHVVIESEVPEESDKKRHIKQRCDSQGRVVYSEINAAALMGPVYAMTTWSDDGLTASTHYHNGASPLMTQQATYNKFGDPVRIRSVIAPGESKAEEMREALRHSRLLGTFEDVDATYTYDHRGNWVVGKFKVRDLLNIRGTQTYEMRRTITYWR